MIFLTDAKGNAKLITPENIYQGSNGANDFYLIAPFAASNNIFVGFELPSTVDGTPLSFEQLEKPSKINDSLNVWHATVNLPVTQYYGTVKFQFRVVNQTGVIIATGRGSFEVLRGTDVVLPSAPTEDVYLQILAAISQTYADFDSKVDVQHISRVQQISQKILNNESGFSLELQPFTLEVKFTDESDATKVYNSYKTDDGLFVEIDNKTWAIKVFNETDDIVLTNDQTTVRSSSGKIEIGGITYTISQNNNFLIDTDIQKRTILEIAKNGVITINGAAVTTVFNLIEAINSHNTEPDAHKDIREAIPTKTSQLVNDSGFLLNTANNLLNYYLKTETYTKAEVNFLVSKLQKTVFKVVDELPATGEDNIIYLVPVNNPSEQNYYEEYIWVDNKWELIGTTQIDLSNYAKLSGQNTFTGKQIFDAETEFNQTAQHNADIHLNNSSLQFNDTAKGLVSKFNADEILIEEGAKIYNLLLPKKSGTFAVTADIVPIIDLA